MTDAPKKSIRVRFSTVFVFVLAGVMIVGGFSAWRLNAYRTTSEELRDRFFRSTQYLGDLNNYTSDLRAVEGTNLLSRSLPNLAADARDVTALDHEIILAQRHYSAIAHDPGERAVYREFTVRWRVYRQIVDRVLALLAQGRKAEAVTLYVTTSRSSFAAASDTLGQLTALNVRKAAFAAQQADMAFRQTRLLTLAAMLFAAVMVIAGLAYMRRSIADPLIDLARAMNALAHNELDIAIHGAERSDEIGGMARAVEVFRLNAIDLAVGQRALADQASLLTDQLAAEQRLTQLQRNFLAMASHEFRTPLAIVDGQAQRLISARNRLSPDDLAQRAGKIRRAVLRITSVIDHLIEHARLVEKGADTMFEPVEVDLVAVLRDVCRLHRELVPTAVIAEHYSAPALTLTGDGKLLMHMFSNLVSNGIKYSGADVRLTVSASATARDIVVIVADRGIGIPEAEQEQVFERFFRGANTGGTIGTGIGLYLVKTVVEMHRGEIALDSLEQGSRFTIRLPRQAGTRLAADRRDAAIPAIAAYPHPG